MYNDRVTAEVSRCKLEIEPSNREILIVEQPYLCFSGFACV